VRGDALLRDAMHFLRADLHFEGLAVRANNEYATTDRGWTGMAMKSLMRPGTGRQVLWMIPRAP